MPQFRVLSWNANGESAQKAACLDHVLATLDRDHGWRPEVVLIQEANQSNDGALAEYLAQTQAFELPIDQVPEGGTQGRSYLMAVAHHVEVRRAGNGRGLFAHALGADPGVQEWIRRTFPAGRRQLVQREIDEFRHLGVAELAVAGHHVRLATWHAPRGGSFIGTAPSTLPGGANPDAFLALEVSDLYRELLHPAAGGASILAGDLNISQAAIRHPIVLADGQSYEVLEGWSGYGRGLDFVLGRAAADPVTGGFDYTLCTGPGGSDHPIVGATLA